jgi:hypothetical protein
MHADVASLLAAHGLAGASEAAFVHTGFSGATLTRLVREDGAAFVLKRMSLARDWIMRATDDDGCREVAMATARMRLGPTIASPSVGASRDGDSYALLMQDISDYLLPQGVVLDELLDLILIRIGELHSRRPPAAVPWCDPGKRLTLLTPRGARIAEAYGAPVARDITEGWRLFERQAPPRVVELIQALWDDPDPLLKVIEDYAVSLLHGDLKFDNIGIDPAGGMWLIDWSMTMHSSIVVEIGWFLAINSRRMARSLDDVLADLVEGGKARLLTVLCGLLLRGWRKALDAEAGNPEELRWWCAGAEAAARLL